MIYTQRVCAQALTQYATKVSYQIPRLGVRAFLLVLCIFQTNAMWNHWGPSYAPPRTRNTKANPVAPPWTREKSSTQPSNRRSSSTKDRNKRIIDRLNRSSSPARRKTETDEDSSSSVEDLRITWADRNFQISQTKDAYFGDGVAQKTHNVHKRPKRESSTRRVQEHSGHQLYLSFLQTCEDANVNAEKFKGINLLTSFTSTNKLDAFSEAVMKSVLRGNKSFPTQEDERANHWLVRMLRAFYDASDNKNYYAPGARLALLCGTNWFFDEEPKVPLSMSINSECFEKQAFWTQVFQEQKYDRQLKGILLDIGEEQQKSMRIELLGQLLVGFLETVNSFPGGNAAFLVEPTLDLRKGFGISRDDLIENIGTQKTRAENDFHNKTQEHKELLGNVTNTADERYLKRLAAIIHDTKKNVALCGELLDAFRKQET